jgi:methylmalonyl-CoA/ethylmalonyl-CoA epimerase
MSVSGLAHVGILLPELDPAVQLLRDRLGLEVRGPEEDAELGVRIAWVTAGTTTLELVAPAREDSRAAAAIARGEAGVHHVALAVDDLDGVLAGLAAAGVPLRDRTPRRGAHQSRVSFLDPAASGGALIELVEPAHG